MAYTGGEAAILTLLRAHASYDSDNTSQAKFDILNTGASKYYAILLQDPDWEAPIEWITPTVYTITWQTLIEVWQRYTAPSTTANALWGHIQEVIAQLQPKNKLGLDNVQHSAAEAVSKTMEMRDPDKPDGHPLWLKQGVSIRWVEQYDPVTFV